MELRLNLTLFGSDPFSVSLGFVKTAKDTLTLEELKTVVTGGHYPIVCVDLHPIDGLYAIHAMVVVDMSEQEVVVLDPLQGEHQLPIYAFTAAWARRHNLAMLVVRELHREERRQSKMIIQDLTPFLHVVYAPLMCLMICERLPDGVSSSR